MVVPQLARASSAQRASRGLAPSLEELDQLIRQRGRAPVPHLRSEFAREALAARLPRQTSCTNAMSMNVDHGPGAAESLGTAEAAGGAGADADATVQSPAAAPLEVGGEKGSRDRALWFVSICPSIGVSVEHSEGKVPAGLLHALFVRLMYFVV